MSGRTHNLSLNRVDWARRHQLLTLEPSALHTLLLSMPLRPADDDDRATELKIRRRLEQPLGASERFALEFSTLLTGLRVDRPRYARRAIELLEAETPDLTWVRITLEQLAFPGGAPRMGGELWLIDPFVLLAIVDPSVAAGIAQTAAEMGHEIAPFTPLRSEPAVIEAMGGLDADGEPRDQAYDPATVSRIAAALDQRPRPLPAVPKGLIEALEALSIWRPADAELPLEAILNREVTSLHELYARAHAEGHGVDVCWHANP